MTEPPASHDELRTTEMRLARLSVLQELTASALVLGMADASVDEFLQHASECMSFVAVLWIARDAEGCIELRAAAGLSRLAREQPITCSQRSLVEVELPYPELASDDIDCWSIALSGIDDGSEHCLRFYFVRETHSAPGHSALARRVAEMFQAAISHRALYTDLQRSYHQLEQAQHALVERERLAALGEMAAAIAHEVRNPLGAIFNSLATLKKIVRRDPAATDELLSIVDEEAMRLNDIVSDLLEFAKPGGMSATETTVEEVFEATIDAARSANAIPPEVHLEVVVDDDLPRLHLDVRLLRQALLNLLANAIQVTPPNGRVLLRASRQQGSEGARLRITVADQGAGIEPSARDLIFEPFFTTKSSGTGLGLAIVKRVVEAHGGRIEVESSDASGATFAVVLPLLPSG